MDKIMPGLESAPNLHPMFVHFPIAFWVAAFGFCLLGAIRGNDRYVEVARWLLYLGLAGAVAALWSGYAGANAMGHDSPGHGLVHTHRNFMIVASGLALVSTIVAIVLRRKTDSRSRWILSGLLAVTVIVTALGADRGAELVFRYGIGTKAEPLPASPHDHHGHDHDH